MGVVPVTAVVLAALVAVLFLPGLALGATAGLRGWLLAGAAPLVTFGAIGVLAPILPALFGRFSVAGFAAGVALLCVVMAGVRLLARRWMGPESADTRPPMRWAAIHHVAIAGAVLATAVSRPGNRRHLEQLFHRGPPVLGRHLSRECGALHRGNRAIRPGRIARGGPDVGTFFYPNAFHVFIATVLQVSQGSLVPTLNMQAGLTAGLLALTMVTLVRQTIGRPALAFAVAVVCGMFSAFPFDLAFFGPLWPFACALALLPGLLALLTYLVRERRPPTIILMALGLIGMTALHPSVAFAAGIAGIAFLIQRWVGRRRVPVPELAALAAAGVLAGIYVVPVMLLARQAGDAGQDGWPAITTPIDAARQLFYLQHEAETPQLVLIIASAAGILAVRRLLPLLWWLVAGAVFAFLFILAAAVDTPWASLLTDPWWDDRWRFAAITTLALLLLAANGLVAVRDLILKVPIIGAGRADLVRPAVLAIIVLVVVGASDGAYHTRNILRIANAYQSGPTLDTGEQAALVALSKLAPPGSLIMNDSNDGSAWMAALHGLRPVFGHALPVITLAGIDPERRLLYDHFDELQSNTRVQDVIQRLGIDYVIVGEGFASPNSTRAPGLDALDGIPALRPVFANESARIYRVELDQTPN